MSPPVTQLITEGAWRPFKAGERDEESGLVGFMVRPRFNKLFEAHESHRHINRVLEWELNTL